MGRGARWLLWLGVLVGVLLGLRPFGSVLQPAHRSAMTTSATRCDSPSAYSVQCKVERHGKSYPVPYLSFLTDVTRGAGRWHVDHRPHTRGSEGRDGYAPGHVRGGAASLSPLPPCVMQPPNHSAYDRGGAALGARHAHLAIQHPAAQASFAHAVVGAALPPQRRLPALCVCTTRLPTSGRRAQEPTPRTFSFSVSQAFTATPPPLVRQVWQVHAQAS